MEDHRKVVVIGAGVSGLVTLKTMKQLGIDCVIYEANDYHGGIWRFHPDNYGVTEFTHINVDRYNYAFSDFPFPDEGPEFAHHSAIAQYLDSYVEHFNLAKDIQYGTKVVSVHRIDPMAQLRWEEELPINEEANWTVVCERDGVEFTTTCEYLVIATGHHAKPKIPTFPGEDKFEGEIIHSIKYKDVLSSGFQEKNVVLVGIGNSSVDIADNLVTRGRCPKVHIASRSGAWVMSNYMFGSAGGLYLNRLGGNASPSFTDKLIKWQITLLSGHPNKWGLHPKYGPMQSHPTVSPTLLHHIQRGRVQVSSNIQEIGKDYIQFDDGTVAEDVKAIIKCTGYTIQLPYLDRNVRDTIFKEETNELKMYHVVFSPEYGTSLAMIGYIQPIGSLASISEIQAQWLGMLIKGKCSLPSKNDMKERIVRDKMANSHYNVSTRHTIQRNVIPYCDEIASYFGAKPRLLDHLALAPRLLISSCGVAQWTLQGPYHNPKAKEYVRKVPVPPASIVINLSINGIFLYLLFTFIRVLFYILFSFFPSRCT